MESPLSLYYKLKKLFSRVFGKFERIIIPFLVKISKESKNSNNEDKVIGNFHKMPQRGILYIAFGEKYIAETIHSAVSIKKIMPELSITLFSDTVIKNPVIDRVELIDTKHFRCKVDHIYNSPYEYTLYLDSDTKVVFPLEEMFGILEKYDLAFTNDFARKRNKWCRLIPEYNKIPYAFSEFGGGVILFKKSAGAKDFFDLWKQYFYKYKNLTFGWDQASLRVSAWKSKALIHTLPIEYNIRSQQNRNKVNKLLQSGEENQILKPRILHWHGLDNETDKTLPYKY